MPYELLAQVSDTYEELKFMVVGDFNAHIGLLNQIDGDLCVTPRSDMLSSKRYSFHITHNEMGKLVVQTM